MATKRSISPQISFLSALALAIIAVAASALAQQKSGPSGWKSLATATFAAGTAVSKRISVPETSERVTAVRLTVDTGTLDVARVIVSYRNGQAHFEDRSVKIGRGQPLGPIDEREDAHQIEAIEIVFASGFKTASAITVTVEGLAAPPSPPDRVAVSARAPAGPTPAGPKTRGISSTTTSTGATAEQAYSAVPVFFGTDRRREPDRAKWNRQIASFSGAGAGALTLGRAMVSVPKAGREKGEIRRPEWDLFFTTVSLRAEDLSKDFTLLDVAVLDRAKFIAEVQAHRSGGKTYKDQAFVFVHGYRVSFDDALFRAAQIAHDMNFDGLPFVFSWPSSAGVAGYLYDEKQALGARDSLREFLEMVTKESGATKVHLIAHSMGAQTLLEVLRDIQNAGGAQAATKPRFNEVILAAPDVTRENFQQIVSRVRGLSSGMTLYASANDRALRLSQRLSGASAGHVPSGGPIVVAGVDSIDVSAASTDFFGLNHAPFADRQPLLDDMGRLLGTGRHPPDQRLQGIFAPVTGTGGLYWKYVKGN